MKKITLFFILCNILIGFSQTPQSYRINFNNLNYRITAGVKNRTSSNIDIKIYYEDGTNEQLYYRPIANNGDNEQGWSLAPFTRNKKPTRVSCHVYVNFRTGTDANDTRWANINYPCPNINFNEGYSPRMTAVSFNLKVTPVLNITTPSGGYLPTENLLVLNSQTGFLPNDYNWEYSFNQVSWTTLPQYNGSPSISVNAFDILGSNAENYLGQTIYFRQSACNRTVFSSAKHFVILKSAPKITTSPPLTTNTLCYDSNDGTATIKFNRQILAPNEQMSITLDRQTSPGVFVGLPSIINPTFDANNNLILPNLEAGLYQLRILGFYNTSNTYSPYTGSTPYEFTINKSAPVDFTLSKKDIWCNGSNNGEITINATGDDTNYFFSLNGGVNWTPFDNGNTHTILNLIPNTYTIKVKDGRDCIAKVQVVTTGGIIQLGAEKELSETITQPNSPVSVTYTRVEPTFFGGTNGRIVARVVGGTRFTNDTYQFEWKNSANVLQTATGSFDGTAYIIILDNIPSDTYNLTIRDKNYSLEPVNNLGCTVSNSQFVLSQPDPIIVTFQLVKPISCNDSNEFGNDTDMNPADSQRDESQDGILVANVTGGVQLTSGMNGGLLYYYTWKKQQPNGTWLTITNTDNIAENLSHGNYALNVEDKNGIKLGTYVNNLLVTETDVTYFMIQPSKLNLNFTNGMPTCNPGSNGWAKANVTGGTPPYTYQWSNGQTTETISNLNANPYFVVIKDARGCTVQGTIVINSPNGLSLTEDVKKPTCFEGNDGRINILPTGGTPFSGANPYLFLWNNGATTQSISGLTEGTYSVIVTDQQGCSFSKNFTLIHPQKIPLELGENRVLCNNQTLNLNVQIQDTNATYNWTSSNGFTSNSPNVSLSQAGTYTVLVTNGVGCQIQDQITITTKNLTIDSEFLVTSQAYVNEEIVIVNTSNPFGQNTQWIVPNSATIIEQTANRIVIKFGSVGLQTISLKQTQEDCVAYFSKNINIEQRSTLPDPGVTDNPFITEFTVFPNPSTGNFEVKVKLQEISPIKLRLFPYTGQAAVILKSENGSKEYNVNFNTTLSAGTYVLVLETAKQTLVKKVIIL